MSTHNAAKSVKWVEGLRGITSFLVILTHMARAWDYPLFYPKDSGDAPGARLLQLPIFRIPFQGRIGVPIFAFLTGFVCAYKPLKLAAKDQFAQARYSIARSVFRRPPRLILPATIATFGSFVLLCLGGYRTSKHCDNNWVRYDTPEQQPTFSGNVALFFHALITTWTNRDNPFDRHQWAMRPLLIGAFQVYLVLMATLGMRFKYRVTVHLTLWLYWWQSREGDVEVFGANLVLGTLLADLSLHVPLQNFIARWNRVLTFTITPMLIISGLYIGSYPPEHADWMPWSEELYQVFVNPDPQNPKVRLGTVFVPPGTRPQTRLTTVCVQFCAVAIFLSPSLRDVLSHPWLTWLGHHSFAVYLVHGTILRTVGTWIVYGMNPEGWIPAGFNEDGSPRPEHFFKPRGRGHTQIAVVVFTSLTYLAAWAWMKYVDTACARTTQWVENHIFEQEDPDAAEKRLPV